MLVAGTFLVLSSLSTATARKLNIFRLAHFVDTTFLVSHYLHFFILCTLTVSRSKYH